MTTFHSYFQYCYYNYCHSHNYHDCHSHYYNYWTLLLVHAERTSEIVLELSFIPISCAWQAFKSPWRHCGICERSWQYCCTASEDTSRTDTSRTHIYLDCDKTAIRHRKAFCSLVTSIVRAHWCMAVGAQQLCEQRHWIHSEEHIHYSWHSFAVELLKASHYVANVCHGNGSKCFNAAHSIDCHRPQYCTVIMSSFAVVWRVAHGWLIM